MTYDEIEEEIRHYDSKMQEEEDSYSDDEFNSGTNDSERDKLETAKVKQQVEDAIDDEVDELFKESELAST